MGVAFLLDGFGGADSSLLQLRRLPVVGVRIHPLLFQPTRSSRDAGALACATLAMVRAMGLRSIATGIDSARQLVFLKAQQCDEFEGTLVDAPLAAEAFVRKWLAQQG
jgi:EAL domain-containing protein (putative c-di-GMP-specific phosphodiesterase class I)